MAIKKRALSPLIIAVIALSCFSLPFLAFAYLIIRGPFPRDGTGMGARPMFCELATNDRGGWWSPVRTWKDREDVRLVPDTILNLGIVLAIHGADADDRVDSIGIEKATLWTHEPFETTVYASGDRVVWVSKSGAAEIRIDEGVVEEVVAELNKAGTSAPILDVILRTYRGPDRTMLETLVNEFRAK